MKVSTGNTEMTTLRAEKLVKIYGRRRVVNEIDLEARTGEIVGLLGPNGAGKTTSFYMITGMIRPNQGKIYLDDEDITKLPTYKRAQKGIGYLAQEPSVFRKLSVEDNLCLVLEMFMKDKKEIRDKIDSLIDEFKLEHVRKNKGFALSGGERRRTEIARALATDPKFILLDEPFAGIDPIAVEDIQEMVVKLKDRGIGVIITDHNVHETLSITDHSYLLYQGEILKAGTAEFLANDPEARRLYLGAKFKLDR
ncbi:MAG: LPS export ABC transporter ATP-binding protein [Candidatus Marinimicrobia bacterium]|nr:LPS export ABC transporter ATP-binding protein [Candidatus Neomarinimicrobiota bacterium]